MTPKVTITFNLATTDATAKLGFEAWIDERKFLNGDPSANLCETTTTTTSHRPRNCHPSTTDRPTDDAAAHIFDRRLLFE